MQVNNIILGLNEDEQLLKQRAASSLGIDINNIKKIRVIKKSVDARKKGSIRLVYSVDAVLEGESEERPALPSVAIDRDDFELRPVIAGFGPSGMFAALVLARHGIKPIILERGGDVDTRTVEVEKFWSQGILNPDTNVQFGEGGAGTFSDGKLTTNTKSVYHRFILSELVRLGAPEEITYSARPHIGTDNLRRIVKNLRNELIEMGCDIHFNCALTDFDLHRMRVAGVTASDGRQIETDALFLAVGHSARDVYTLLGKKGIAMQAKGFSVGVRIEHLQSEINKSQYGELYNHPKLQPAEYKMVYHDTLRHRGAYTFCMCPGGVVVGSSTDLGIVTNGMSDYRRAGANANSALLVSINPEDFSDTLGGLEFQERIEQSAYKLSGGFQAPAMTVGDFLNSKSGRRSTTITPTYRPGVVYTDFNEIFPEFICSILRSAIKDMGAKLKGFDNPDAVLTAPETRSSAPLTVLRKENGQSLNTKGLFPVGEGCGYAGGIMSSAADGITAALNYLSNR